MTKNVDAHIFSFPSEDDVAGVDKDDVVMILSRLYSLGTSTRYENLFDILLRFLSTCHIGGQWHAVTSEIDHATGTPKTGHAIGYFMGS